MSAPRAPSNAAQNRSHGIYWHAPDAPMDMVLFPTPDGGHYVDFCRVREINVGEMTMLTLEQSRHFVPPSSSK